MLSKASARFYKDVRRAGQRVLEWLDTVFLGLGFRVFKGSVSCRSARGRATMHSP